MPSKKRGRKPKPKPEPDPIDKPPHKKRGRKPKGGKIVLKKEKTLTNKIIEKPNIILHLKCSSESLTKQGYNQNDFDDKMPKSFSINNNNKINNLNLYELNSKNIEIKETIILANKVKLKPPNSDINLKDIWGKLYKLKQNLKINNVSDKKSACFWCTYKFDNPAIYIPKCYINNNIEVYGCFCSPQCAVSYLKNEHIDNSTRWERYALLNNIYGSIYNYKKNIKPAPNPYYTLDKFYGNLEINEYRKLLNNQTLLMVVDKPMTKITPEIYEDNNEIPDVFNNLLDNNVLKNKSKSSSSSYRLQRKFNSKNKNSIVANTIFNIN